MGCGLHDAGRRAAASLLLVWLVASLGACSIRLFPEVEQFRDGAVAADHEIASKAGAEILKAGGNAVDAAVATSFTLSVVRPYSCGIGGGGFMVIHLSDEAVEDQRKRGRDVPRDLALNYREMAPGAITPDYFERHERADANVRGASAAAVPGTVRGLLHAHARYGVLPLGHVMEPAIRSAEDGFLADADYAEVGRELIKGFEEHPERKERFGFVWRRFLREGKVKEGDRIRLPEQAEALRLIAARGESAFYSGPIGEAIVGAMSRDGGLITLDDLAAFRVVEVEPLQFETMGRTFLTMPPPSSGGVAIAEALAILEHWEPWWHGATVTPYPQVYLMCEALKHAFADRAEWLADPAFAEVPVKRLISPEYTRGLADRIDPRKTQPPEAYGSRRAVNGRPEIPALPEDGGTSHFCVVDRTGSAVSCTETINLEFGSLLAVEEFGFCLNNEMDDFTTKRGAPNAFGLTQADRNLPEPGKRPLSSMTPTIVLASDGGVELVIGASGGPRIISSTLQVTVSALLLNDSWRMGGFWSLPGSMLLAGARFHHQWSPDELYVERTWLDMERQQREREPTAQALPIELLRRAGHTVEPRDEIGTVQLIKRAASGAGWDAGCDPRKGGKPAGVGRVKR